MKNRKIELSVNNREEVIELPINPATVEFTETQLNEKVTLLAIGEANLKGNRGLAGTSLSSFFPSKKSPFYKYAGKAPKKYVEMIKKWKANKLVVRVIVTDMGINMAMLIDNFNYSMNEGDGDIYYTLDLSEYRVLNVSSTKAKEKAKNNGLKERPDTLDRKKRSHTVVKGDNLYTLAKKYYKDGSQYKKIYDANKDKIKNSNMITVGMVLVIP
ncbi:MAG: LysM peptidoglycan-binding domain-containing protein [Hungatella sp.]